MLHGAAGIDALVGTKSIATFCHRAQLLRLRHLVAACLIMIWCFLASLSQAQPAAEDHLKHHPDPDATLQPDTPVQPSAGDMMQSMGGMMEGMFQLPPKALYPSLMELPELTPEKQDELQAAAQDRIQSGMGMTSEGHDQLVIARRSGDLSAMQQALRMLEEGTAILRSGVATQRAIAERDTPQDIALNWFRAEMNLNASAREEVPGLFGVSWFHFSVMVGLFVSVSAMLWLYFGKMQRASQLLQSLTGVGDADSVHAVQPQVHEDMLTGAPATTGAASQASKKKWAGQLRVGRIFSETPDVKTFRFINPLGGRLPFDYLPGQFITVTASINNKTARRGYTIASSPTQQDYVEITVKNVAGGLISGHLHSDVQEGDLVELSGPAGSFVFTGRECKCILLIAAGVGITPLMSVLRYLLDRSWSGEIFLIYGCKSPDHIIFKEELDYLHRRHANLRVVITVSITENTLWDGPRGRITKDLIVESVPDISSRYVHICGPVPMMESTRKILVDIGVPIERIKTEAFGPALGKSEKIATSHPPLATHDLTSGLPTVAFVDSDKAGSIAPERTVLDVAEDVGVDIDYSCREGICGVCRVHLLKGKVTMAIEDGLEPGDKENNMILACQAKTTENISVKA
tara:strand:- start:2117 stop:4015 length:1899 start_codon:yes stop_codon:yes gene_type:complete